MRGSERIRSSLKWRLDSFVDEEEPLEKQFPGAAVSWPLVGLFYPSTPSLFLPPLDAPSLQRLSVVDWSPSRWDPFG